MNKNKPIGSDFHLPLGCLIKKPTNEAKKYIPRRGSIFLTAGRNSIAAIVDKLKIKSGEKVIIPGYVCKEIVQTLVEKGLQVDFCRVEKGLKLNTKEIKKKIDKKTRAVLIVHYFGFPQEKIEEIKDICKTKGVVLIEDCVQSPFSTYKGKPLGSFSKWSLNSYRKYMPVPDGAILSYENMPEKIRTKKSIYHFLYVYGRFFMMVIKAIQMYLPIPNKMFYKPMRLIDRLCLERMKNAMKGSRLSMYIIKRTDIKRMIIRRRKNFLYLLKNMPADITPIYNSLTKGVCPLGFPITTKKREEIKKRLIENNIYPAIHWTIPDGLKGRENKLWRTMSEEMLTLPIDQRYGKEEMQKIIDVIKNGN